MPLVLIVGGGGREHALGDLLARSPSRPELLFAPGNAGVEALGSRAAVAADDVRGLVALAQQRRVDLVVVGPEVPLVLGLADELRRAGIPVFGPGAQAARLEGSKAFAKEVMDRAGVPTARWARFTEVEPARAFAATLSGGAVVKADGLAAGKGVVVADTQAEAARAVMDILGGAFGSAGASVVVEERLTGPELSVLALTDGRRLALLAPAQDHKRVHDGDRGPNTGGMGAYAPAPLATPELLREVEARCLRPVLELLAASGAPFQGVLYAGLMLTPDGPKVLEYNARFGDPEAEVILPLCEADGYALLRAAALGALPEEPLAFARRSALTVVMAAAGYPGDPRKGDAIEGLDRAAALEDVRVFHAGTRRREGSAVIETCGGRVLAVTGLGDDLPGAARRAYAGVECIRFAGEHHRRDIGARALGRAFGG